MPKLPGADPRPYPFSSKTLDRFTPAGVEALALVGLALLDRINAGQIVVSDRAMLEALYVLQDALHGPADGLPGALAAFLSTAEGSGHDR